ncbi:hypothetical protein [Streptomyces acidiscabies]|uniref:Uncharacterized protein n=1 Tax=Streptomyces acidiscabies TaxID=42234 RepID=A0A0L0JT13_9ACTN|nr:hypothetical protein [Streptomyces acidiscabies]KND28716.1 hypothetical protein IQ63_32930 [Streptomyces acidiscabies]
MARDLGDHPRTAAHGARVMTALTGLPDLGHPLAALPGAAFRARDLLGLGVLLPSDLTLEPLPEGGVALLVTLLREGLTAVGRIEAGFAVAAPLTAAGEAAAASGTPLLLSAAEPLSGVLEVTTGLGKLFPPVLLGPDTLTTTRVVAELPAEPAVLAARLVRTGTMPLDAALRLTFRAVAPTLPLRATVDPQALLATLTHRFGPNAVLPFDTLATALDEAVFGAPSRPDRATALALRLRPAVTRPEPAAGPLHRLLDQVPAATLALDLADPTAVDVDRVLALDLQAAARALADDPQRYVREVDAPELPTGRTTVTFAANLPAPVAGLALLLADLRVPPSATRPQEVTTSVTLTAPGGVTSTQITLAPGERLQGEVRLRAVLDGVGELEGPWRPADTTLLTLPPDAFPLPLAVVRATRALTALAVAEVRTAGGVTVGRVDAAGPVLAVPVTETDPPATITVRPLGPGLPVEVPVDRRRVELDPATLPGFGTHLARLRHAPASGPLTVQWRPEGDEEAEPQTVRLDADRPQADIRWVATSPFQPGVVWRAGSGNWSAPVPPRDFLTIDVDPPVLVDGVELHPDPAHPDTWTYVPPGPFLDTPDAVRLIEADAVSFLQVTSRIDLPDARRDALRGALAPGADVRPAPVRVTRVAVETKSPDGVWTAVAEGTSSGIPPWTTALSASLDGDRQAAARAALGGTAGWMVLVAELTVAGKPERRTRDFAGLITTPHH